MDRTTSGTHAWKSVPGGPRAAIAGLWPALPLAHPTRRWIERMSASVGDASEQDDEHDGWQPIRLRRHPTAPWPIARARSLRRLC
jgi:hypothetical protein